MYTSVMLHFVTEALYKQILSDENKSGKYKAAGDSITFLILNVFEHNFRLCQSYLYGSHFCR